MTTAASVAQAGRIAGLRTRAAAHWRTMAAREQAAVLVAGTLVALALVWLVGIQPAWRTWREAPARIEALDLQLQAMRSLADEAGTLRGAAPISPAQATAALEAATARLGPAGRLAIVGDRATLTLTGADALALGEWLQAARSAGRARPVEAQLIHGAGGWSGTLVVSVGGPA